MKRPHPTSELSGKETDDDQQSGQSAGEGHEGVVCHQLFALVTTSTTSDANWRMMA
jgi:hypothetical protein